MNIGGTDISFRVTQSVQIQEVVLHALREFWPEYVFQDADEVELHDNNEPGPWWLYATASTEFFIYCDRKAAKAWMDQGGIPGNQSSMLHFLIDVDQSIPGPVRQVTVVVGEPTGEVAKFVGDLKKGLRRGTNLLSSMPVG